ncbi:MAG: hypothetical protein J6Y85_01530 [Alphaproteobacteria bacterium]|nr:hypothetical protein [Alphaproteobacteria bacterium]
MSENQQFKPVQKNNWLRQSVQDKNKQQKMAEEQDNGSIFNMFKTIFWSAATIAGCKMASSMTQASAKSASINPTISEKAANAGEAFAKNLDPIATGADMYDKYKGNGSNSRRLVISGKKQAEEQEKSN